MLVRRSTVDFRSCNLSGLLAGKLFWNTNTTTGQWCKCTDQKFNVKSMRILWEYTLYIERSILRELCSWSNSFTNLSFCNNMRKHKSLMKYYSHVWRHVKLKTTQALKNIRLCVVKTWTDPKVWCGEAVWCWHVVGRLCCVSVVSVDVSQ